MTYIVYIFCIFNIIENILYRIGKLNYLKSMLSSILLVILGVIVLILTSIFKIEVFTYALLWTIFIIGVLKLILSVAIYILSKSLDKVDTKNEEENDNNLTLIVKN